MAAKRAEKERLEKERVEAFKQKEVQRIRMRNEKSDVMQSPLQHSTSHDLIAQNIDNANNNMLQKSSSIVNVFGERLRRNSDASNVKRAESMKIGKLPKRTPSFTTRRRAQSFRKQHPDPLDLPPVEIKECLNANMNYNLVVKKRRFVRGNNFIQFCADNCFASSEMKKTFTRKKPQLLLLIY